jgi:hypothetical protein
LLYSGINENKKEKFFVRRSANKEKCIVMKQISEMNPIESAAFVADYLRRSRVENVLTPTEAAPWQNQVPSMISIRSIENDQ